MIVLLVSLAEATALIDGKPDKALKGYLARACQMERDLPDENLPQSVRLDRLACDGRDYLAVVREFATSEQADQAWKP